MNEIHCVACGSKDVEDNGEWKKSDELRPNGEKLHEYECKKCATVWAE